jgi:hypothetical protein
MRQMNAGLDANGYAIVAGAIAPPQIAELAAALGPVDRPGRRGLLAIPKIADLANSQQLLDVIRPHMPGDPRPVRAILFNKSPDANWLVGWHQDLTIAVRERRDVPGYGPWSIKGSDQPFFSEASQPRLGRERQQRFLTPFLLARFISRSRRPRVTGTAWSSNGRD